MSGTDSARPDAAGGNLGFDPEALRAKYRHERDKRLRADGNDQYVEVAGAFAHFADDPYVAPGFTREPRTDEIDVVLIGGGFGGLQTAARLREVGVEDVCIVEQGGDFGGTWYWNRYPGAQCDVESYIYMPLLEELGYVPTQKYASAAEILEHARSIGRHYGLYERALFQTRVTELRWDGSVSRWIVSTDRDDRLRARFVAIANGLLSRPKLPGIQGLGDFAGHAFHTARWDYAYTGGGPDGGLEKLRDRRVAVIGTGATAIQIVPHVGAAAKHLYVFQRTPSSVDARNNRPTDPAWAARLEPGWQRRRMENFNALVTGNPQPEDLVADGWTDLIGKTIERFMAGAAFGAQNVAEVIELANFEKMNEIRARVDAIVEDPRTAEALKPYYRMFCKRPCFHDDYLQTFNRPNVTLVDTDGKGVERITRSGVVVAGQQYDVDCIIYATGFEFGTALVRQTGYEIHGRDGLTMSKKFERGLRTLHGIQSHGFPNCFLVGPGQGGFAVNYPQLLDQVARHLAHIVRHALDGGHRTVEPSPEAEDRWVERVVESTRGAVNLGTAECTPGYYNNEGRPDERHAQSAPYGGLMGSIAFWELLRKWREAGDFEGLVFGGS